MVEIIEINSNTWRFEDGFVRFFLLEGEDKAVMIDSGVNCPDALKMAKTRTDKPIMLLNTHGDGDHTSGTAAYKEIHIHPLDYINCEVNTRYPGVALAGLKDGEVIELGGRTLKIIHIPGHTRGSVAILDVNNRVLIAGDSVQSDHIFMFGDRRAPEVYEDSLNKLIALEDEYDCIYASHGEWKLSKDYTRRVKSAWLKVRNGEVDYEYVDLFGNKVKSYTTEDCGFYVE